MKVVAAAVRVRECFELRMDDGTVIALVIVLEYEFPVARDVVDDRPCGA